MRGGVPGVGVGVLQVPACCREEAGERSAAKGLERHGKGVCVTRRDDDSLTTEAAEPGEVDC